MSFTGQQAQAVTLVTNEVWLERERQHAQWGEQSHPDVNPARRSTLVHDEYAAEADAWKLVNEGRVKDGTLAWDGILLEEVFEALAEADPVKLRAELIQAAAVAVAWVEDLDRQAAAETKLSLLNHYDGDRYGYLPGDRLP